MKLWICASVDTVWAKMQDSVWRQQIRDSHMDGFLLETFDVTTFASLTEEDWRRTAAVKRFLEEEGYAVLALGIPLGHPEGLDTPHYTHHAGWHIRRDIHGNLIPWCNAVTPAMLRDIRQYMERMQEMGFAGMFWDDDLRQGNYEGDVQGCFCDDCLAAFSAAYPDAAAPFSAGKTLCREEIAPVLRRDPSGLNAAQLALREAWMDFTCGHITRFLQETTPDGMQTGIMVMHNGDRRHGIDIPAIRRAIPDCLFRVGELMFDDGSFAPPANRRSLVESVLRHMALMGDPARIFSESTVFPHEALTPEHLREKIILERRCGLENINLMGMERMQNPAYYTMLRDNYELFASLPKTLTPETLDEYDFAHIT